MLLIFTLFAICKHIRYIIIFSSFMHFMNIETLFICRTKAANKAADIANENVENDVNDVGGGVTEANNNVGDDDKPKKVVK